LEPHSGKRGRIPAAKAARKPVWRPQKIQAEHFQFANAEDPAR